MNENDLAAIAARADLIATLPPVETRKEVRRCIGVSISELARLVGCTRGFVRRVERGESVPTGEHLVQFAKFYDAARRGQRAA
jgi:transcriptional regulator with XRE-family HTH domain